MQSKPGMGRMSMMFHETNSDHLDPLVKCLLIGPDSIESDELRIRRH